MTELSLDVVNEKETKNKAVMKHGNVSGVAVT